MDNKISNMLMRSDLKRDMKILKVYIELYAENIEDHFVLGGAVRDLNGYNDIDLYSLSLEKANKLMSKFKEMFKVLFETQNALTVEIPGIQVPVQLVYNITGTIEEITNRFDFVMNTGYCTFDGRLNRPIEAQYRELKVKENPLTPQTLMDRTFKFLSRKYWMSKEDYLKMLDLHRKSIESLDDVNLDSKLLCAKYAKEDEAISKDFKKKHEVIPF